MIAAVIQNLMVDDPFQRTQCLSSPKIVITRCWISFYLILPVLAVSCAATSNTILLTVSITLG